MGTGGGGDTHRHCVSRKRGVRCRVQREVERWLSTPIHLIDVSIRLRVRHNLPIAGRSRVTALRIGRAQKSEGKSIGAAPQFYLRDYHSTCRHLHTKSYRRNRKWGSVDRKSWRRSEEMSVHMRMYTCLCVHRLPICSPATTATRMTSIQMNNNIYRIRTVIVCECL